MIKKLIKNALVVLMFGLSTVAFAQNFKVETVKISLEPGPADKTTPDWYDELEKCIANINAAKTHPKTGNDPKMYYYYGLTYLNVYLNGNEVQKAMYPNALDMATDAFYKSMETDLKERYTAMAQNSLLNCAIGHYNNAVSSYNSQDYKGALNSYEKVLRILPYDKDGQLRRSNITEESISQYASYAAIGAKDITKAKALLQKLIDINFNDPSIYGDMADLYLNDGDTTKSLEYLAIGREMFPSNVNLMNKELDIYLKLGRSKEIVDKLNEAILNDPENKIYYYARGVSHMKLGNLEGAQKDYEKTIALDPTFADAHYNLGVVFLDKCNPIIEQINNLPSGSYKKEESLAVEIDNLYKKAAKLFEDALSYGEYANAEKFELVTTLKKIYGRLIQNDQSYRPRYDEVKAMMKELE
ncbi:MAG: tetratricopeptide (TPR) repeat protein [Bacteroidia bacterium]|jgi:tetratricopeptide (TPR) repeat protein